MSVEGGLRQTSVPGGAEMENMFFDMFIVDHAGSFKMEEYDVLFS